MTEFILASKSPRRKILLRNLLDSFIVINPEVDEIELPDENPADFVVRLAREKALEAGKLLSASSIEDILIIAADTIVVEEGKILGKPKNQADANKILNQLKGKTHQVLSGLVLYHPIKNKILARMVQTDVAMREYTDSEIKVYINSGDPMDKAGAYGIQDKPFNPAPAFNQCYANVMGLPLCHLSLLMKEMGYEGNAQVADRCQESIQYQCPVYLSILTETIGHKPESREL